MRTGAAQEGAFRPVHDRAPAPVVIVRVNGAGIDPDSGPAQRCDVRLVQSAHGPPVARARNLDGGELTAVVILQHATPASVVSCVRAATRGGSVSPELLDQLLTVGERTPAGAGEPQLDDREYEVLRMLADGESTRGIAAQLSYSERTVKNIVRDLLVTLNGKTRAHAVALAARRGVI